jgi:hypothetical protein
MTRLTFILVAFLLLTSSSHKTVTQLLDEGFPGGGKLKSSFGEISIVFLVEVSSGESSISTLSTNQLINKWGH